jgi:hypothetical protein
MEVAVAERNLLWEATQFRRRFFSEDDLEPAIREVSDRGDVNAVFVPRTASRYHEYAPLFHLLPYQAVQRHGLPPVRCAQWPYIMQTESRSTGFGSGEVASAASVQGEIQRS